MAENEDVQRQRSPGWLLDVFRTSLAGRFSLMFLALLIPLVVVGSTIQRGLTSNADELLDARRVVELATRSYALVLTQDDVTKEILLNLDRISEAERKIAAYDENRAVLEQIAARSQSSRLDQILQEMRRLEDERLRPLDSQILETLLGEGPAAAQALYFSRYQPHRQRYAELSHRLTQEAERVAEHAEAQLAIKNRQSVLQVVGALLLGVAAVGVIMGLITRHIQQRMGDVVAVLESVARGDLTQTLSDQGRDEIGRMANALERALSGMRAALHETREAANEVELNALRIARATETVAGAASAQGVEVTNAAESMDRVNAQVWGIAESARALRSMVDGSRSTVGEVADMSQHVQESTEQLGERIESTSQAVAEMSASTQRVEECTELLLRASSDTVARMGEMSASLNRVDAVAAESAQLWQSMIERGAVGVSQVESTLRAIEELRGDSRAAADVVGGVGKRAEEIGVLVDVITDVADETQLLALNAAIISAQAGENGRAFGVVSDQIRSLAERVRTQTREIEARIRSVQSQSADAIVAMQRGSESIARVVGLSSAAGAVVQEITQSSRESAQRLSSIAEAVRTQARTSRDVVARMAETDEAVREIRTAVSRQTRGNELVGEAARTMREVALATCARTREQITRIARIGESFEGIRDAAESVETSLQQQSSSTEEIAGFLEKVGSRCSENTRSAELASEASRGLRALAQSLREHISRFRV
jgi:methyl-accepting chemotaxis protein